MKLGDILVCLDPTDAGEHRLHLAATIAREHQAHLSAAYVLTENLAGAAPYGGLAIAAPAGVAGVAEGSLIAGIPAPGIPSAPDPDATRGAALADIIEQRYREALRPHAIEGDWNLFGPGDAAELVALAKTVDLVGYGQASRDYRAPSRFRPEDIAIPCRRPMLVTPYAGNVG